MIGERLRKQMEFIAEIDKLKQVFRQTVVSGTKRQENDAEHSWHFAMMAILLVEYANEPNIDLLKVVKMALIHDLVEIDAGDTFTYDVKAHEDKAEREQKAAERIFGLLPDDQCAEMHALWNEFEERRTPEARFAAALDRLNPLLLNYLSQGETWRKHQVTAGRVIERNQHIADGSAALWEFAQQIIAESIDRGYLQR